MGIARLSHNWLVNTLAAVYVEVVRNIPLLLQLLLVYAIIINVLPQPRESGELLGLVLLNTSGLFLPRRGARNPGSPCSPWCRCSPWPRSRSCCAGPRASAS